jgi:hypothetical protein
MRLKFQIPNSKFQKNSKLQIPKPVRGAGFQTSGARGVSEWCETPAQKWQSRLGSVFSYCAVVFQVGQAPNVARPAGLETCVTSRHLEFGISTSEFSFSSQ